MMAEDKVQPFASHKGVVMLWLYSCNGLGVFGLGTWVFAALLFGLQAWVLFDFGFGNTCEGTQLDFKRPVPKLKTQNQV